MFFIFKLYFCLIKIILINDSELIDSIGSTRMKIFFKFLTSKSDRMIFMLLWSVKGKAFNFLIRCWRILNPYSAIQRSFLHAISERVGRVDSQNPRIRIPTIPQPCLKNKIDARAECRKNKMKALALQVEY